MRANHLAVVFPVKELPQNTEKVPAAVWAAASRMLLPGLGKFYGRFYPAAQPWGVEISTPFGVVVGRDDPCRFLRLYFRAREFQKESVACHAGGTLMETGPEKLQTVDDILICHVTLDGTNKRLEQHALWHMAMAQGVILPDCGVYYVERKRSAVEPGLEKSIESSPADYALSMVTLEPMEERI